MEGSRGEETLTEPIIHSFLDTFPVGKIPCSILAWAQLDLGASTSEPVNVSHAIEEWEALVQRYTTIHLNPKP